jgi:uncharacterized protein involved in exopolysaccharide biosynthesis
MHGKYKKKLVQVMDNGSNTDSNVFDIKVILQICWIYKYLIFIIILFCMISSGYYTLNIKKTYKSDVYFTLGESNNAPNSNNFGTLIGTNNVRPSEKTIEKIMYRVFIEKVDENISLHGDTFFNSYVENSSEPIWKKTLKNIIGYAVLDFDNTEMAWKQIIYNYKKNVSMTATPAENLKLSVTHTIPERSAEIANAITSLVIADNLLLKTETEKTKTNSITSEISSALLEYENVKQELVDFEVKNSIFPEEYFVTSVENLNRLNTLLARTKRLIKAFNKISELLNIKKANEKNYTLLKQEHPIIEELEFRTILGQSETMSKWIWPDINTVKSVLNTLRGRSTRLESQIAFQASETENLSKKAAENNDIKRRLAIAMANYQARLEFFRTADINSIYDATKSEVYEYAAIPITPISPKRNLILALGAAIGLVLGVFIALILNNIKGVINSNSDLIRESATDYAVSLKSFKPLHRKNIIKLAKLKRAKIKPALRELIIEIYKTKTKIVIVSGIKASIKATDFARILSYFISNNDVKVAVLNFSVLPPKNNAPKNKYKDGTFNIVNQFDNVTELRPNIDNNSINFLLNNNSFNEISSIQKDFDLVILSAESQDSTSLTKVMSQNNVFHIGLAKKNATKLIDLLKIKRKLPFGAIIYG